MDYSDEYVDEEAMEAEANGIPQNLLHHPISLGDRVLHAQTLSTPPKVRSIRGSICTFAQLFGRRTLLGRQSNRYIQKKKRKLRVFIMFYIILCVRVCVGGTVCEEN